MTTTWLALRSLRLRPAGFAASFLATFLGAAILMAFASMLDTGAAPGADAASGETLATMTAVAGSWCLLMVVFSVASTLTMSVRQRGREMALLRSIGATPAQVGRMVVGEAAVVAALATVAAIVPAAGLGWVIFDLLQDTGQVAQTVDYRFGPIALVMGVGITLLGATLAALLTVRRTARMRAEESLFAASTGGRTSRKRHAAALAFVATGLSCGVVTATVFRGKGSDAMQTAGQAGIWFAIGLAVLSPAVVRAVAAGVRGPLERVGVVGYLAARNLYGRSHQLGGALMPILLFTAVSTGTLYMQAVEDGARKAAGVAQTDVEKNIETLNFVVVGMIALFAVIMLVNTLVAVTTFRREEFGQQRLAGATPRQVLRMTCLEAAVLVVTGVVLGSIASLVTVVPYAIARTGSAMPDVGVLAWVGVVAVAAIVAPGTVLGTARRAIATPAVVAVAAV